MKIILKILIFSIFLTNNIYSFILNENNLSNPNKIIYDLKNKHPEYQEPNQKIIKITKEILEKCNITNTIILFKIDSSSKKSSFVKTIYKDNKDRNIYLMVIADDIISLRTILFHECSHIINNDAQVRANFRKYLEKLSTIINYSLLSFTAISGFNKFNNKNNLNIKNLGIYLIKALTSNLACFGLTKTLNLLAIRALERSQETKADQFACNQLIEQKKYKSLAYSYFGFKFASKFETSERFHPYNNLLKVHPLSKKRADLILKDLVKNIKSKEELTKILNQAKTKYLITIINKCANMKNLKSL